MYKIVFIDDEAITLKLLSYAIDWANYDVTIAGTAQDGQEGIALIRQVQPDIVIADIRMPNMTGLEFAEEVRRFDQNLRIVFLSAYAEFEYAQKAITFGASDYLLKPLDEVKLEALIGRLTAEIGEQRSAQQREQQRRTQELENRLLKGYRSWLENGAGGEIQEPQFSGCFCVLTLLPTEGSLSGEQAKQVRSAMSRCLDSFVLMEYRPGVFFLLCSEQVVAENLRQQLQEAGIRTAIGEGSGPFLYPGMHHAELAAEQTFWSADKIGKNIPNSCANIDWKRYQNCDDAIRHFVEQGRHQELMRHLEQMLDEAQRVQAPPGAVFEHILDLLIRIKLTMMQFYGETPLAQSALSQIDCDRLRACGGKIEVLLFLSYRLENLASEIQKLRTEDTALAAVRRAQEYTRKNYHRSDFSLQETADYVGLSKNHFSRVYHTSTGVKFWDYVTRMRMERACQMLREDMPISEICHAVGYETEAHFNKKFKQMEGLTPGRYRKLHQK